MAEKVKFTIEVDDKGSVKVIDQLNDSIKDTKKAADTAEKAVGDVSKSVEKGEGAFKKLGATIKGGLGIGLVVGALDSLRDGLMENQKVQDLMNTAMVVFQGTINGVIEVLEPLFNGLQKVFKDPVQSIKDFGNLIKENMITRFEGLLELLPKLGEAIGLLFKGEFSEAGKVATNALGKVVLGVEDTIGVVTDLGTKASAAFTTIAKSTKKAFDNREVLAQAENNINKLSILYTGIVEQYDLMAEKQRQIRDDETKTIAERVKANEELAKILDEGAKKEKENLQSRIGILQTQQNLLGKTKERELEILSLRQELTGVDAKYAGLKSEQLTNINALEKEAIELKRAEAEGTIEANAIIAQSEADRLADSLEGFDARKKAIDEEYKSRSELLATEISQLKEGTQAYVDAVNEKKVLDAQYTADSKALRDELVTYMGEKAEEEIELNKEVAQAKVDALMQGIQGVQELVSADSKYGKALAIAQAVINTYQGASKAIGQGGIFGPIAAAGVIASGLAQVRSIMQTELPESPMGGGGGGSSVSMPSGPSVGIVSGQMNQTNQLQAQLNSQMAKPTRAYVVGQNVTSQQSLDRHILQNATL